MRCYLILLVVFLAGFVNANSQCIAPLAFPNSNGCSSGMPLMDNVNIGPGQTYSFTGTSGSFSNISMSGGVLLLCSGTVTINNLNFNSGDIAVFGGTTATFAGTFNVGNNVSFHNAGNTTFNQSVTVQGPSNFIYNAPGGTMTVNGDLTIFNSGQFINAGLAVGQNVILNSGASMCFDNGSQAQVTSVQNDATDPITVSSGTACVSYTSTFGGNAPITASSGLQICQKPGASNPNPAVVGAATVFPNCSVCPLGAPTPVRLISFRGRIVSNRARLEWVTAFEENVRSFVIERSIDGVNFVTVGEVSARNQPSSYVFEINIEGNSFYRLKMVDIDGKFAYSNVVYLKVFTGQFQLTLLTNPVYGGSIDLSVDVSKNQHGHLILVDQMGKILKDIPVVLVKGNNSLQGNITWLAKGNYYMRFTSDVAENKATVSFIRM